MNAATLHASDAGRAASPPRLYWNSSGQVNCEQHAPYRGSDTWKHERWQRVPPCDETAALECEVCRSVREGRRAR
jgi:hypothetical protein